MAPPPHDVAVELAAAPGGDEKRLFDWVEQVCGGRIVKAVAISGGNRAKSWSIDVSGEDGETQAVFLRYSMPRPPSVEPYTLPREAQVHRAIATSGVKTPRLIAEHPDLPAILMTRVPGVAELRRLKDPGAKSQIADQLMGNLARLHAMPIEGVRLDAGVESGRIIDHVRAEIGTWNAMYREMGAPDPLIEFAFQWLDANVPDPDEPPVLVHGDAGPGNFLYEGDRLTALIDWELAHIGDPMEDLAWFLMRCVMEPVPDASASLDAYARHAGRALDRDRILYHRVLVSTRVVVIRHRNVTGEPGNAIVSRALNRRLLVQAIAEASGVHVEAPAPPRAPPTPRDGLFEGVIDDLRDKVAAFAQDGRAVAAAKNASKVLKYLRAHDRYGAHLEAAELEALASVLGVRPRNLAEGREQLVGDILAGKVPLPAALRFFAAQTAGEALLAADSSGGIAGRGYPTIDWD